MNVTQTKFAVSFATLEWSVQLPILQLKLNMPVMESFNGDIEKIDRNFHKVFVDAEDPFRGLECNCTRI